MCGRHERAADDLIWQAMQEVRSAPVEEAPLAEALELMEEVKQAKEAFRQRSHDLAFLSTMLETAKQKIFQCPVCLSEVPVAERSLAKE